MTAAEELADLRECVLALQRVLDVIPVDSDPSSALSRATASAVRVHDRLYRRLQADGVAEPVYAYGEREE